MKVFVIAVSGGVDSVVLLHKLAAKKTDTVSYVVAHYDHGIRDDSAEDAAFVADLARDLQLPFESQQGHLGASASEALAREKRYEFLMNVKEIYNADRIITAHHQDDVLETMVLNILRGTGPRGLISLRNTPDILRPLLSTPKTELINYVREHNLQWREDPTNSSDDYLRNYVRHNVMPNLEIAREQLLTINKTLLDVYFELDGLLEHATAEGEALQRSHLLKFSWSVQREIVRKWLLDNGAMNLDRKIIERVTIAIKCLPHGKKIDINDHLWLISQAEKVVICQKVEANRV